MATVRYLVPNLLTFAAMLLGVASIVLAAAGDVVNAAWFILWGTFADRLDGLVARTLRATSDFGVQMDSFGDFVNFGLAPAFCLYFALGENPALPFAEGLGHAALVAACATWIFGATFRLARFNVVIDDNPDHHLFFGYPTTLAAALLASWFLVCLKYADPEGPLAAPGRFTELHPFGAPGLGPWVWSLFPVAMVAGAVLMISNVRMRKFGATGGKLVTGFLALVAVTAVILAASRVLPEFVVAFASLWTLVFTALGFVDPGMRDATPPPIFPVGDRG